MLTGVELMQWIEHFARWNVQALFARRQDTRDVFTCLRVERSLELAEDMPFVSPDLVLKKEQVSHLSLRKVERCVQY